MKCRLMYKYVIAAALSITMTYAHDDLEPELKNLATRLLQKSDIDSVELIKTPETFHSFAAICVQFSPGIRYQMFLNETLLKELSRQEQAFVILHEIGHLKDNPSLGLIATFAPSLIAGLSGLSYFLACKKTFKNSCASMAVATALYGISKLIGAYFLRASEVRADLYAYNQQKNLASACSVLSKRDMLCKTSYPTSWFKRLFEDHPSVEQRIAYLQANS